MSDLLIHNATLPDGRSGVDVLVADGRIVNVSPRINAAAAQTIDAQGYLLYAAVRRPALPHGRDADLRCAARERERHAARGHRAVGRAEAPPDAGRDRRARARVLRLGGGEGAARDPLARRRLRSATARGRGAAAREGEGGALPRPAAGRVSAGRRAAQPRRARPPEARARDGRGRRRRHPALRAHDGTTAPRACGSCASSPRSRGGSSTCIATRPTTPTRATSRRSLRRRCGSACRGG